MELQLHGGMTALLGPELLGVAWVLTYSLHAAIWAAAAALLSKGRSISAALRHRAWQGALLAPFITVWLSFLAVETLASVPAADASAAHVTVVELRDAPTRDAQPSSLAKTSLLVDEGAARRLAHALDAAAVAGLAAAGLGLLRYVASALEARRRLRHRRTLRNGPIFGSFQRACALAGRSGVTLSQSHNADTPLVLGRREICVPALGLSELTDGELEAVFAHELAHLERGDGVWFPIVGLLEALLWVHPITRRVCAEVRQSAELACDARSVELTGEPRALALALTHIASRAVAKGPLALPTMAHPRRGLVARVARLTNASIPHSSARTSGARLLLGLALVGVFSVGLNLRVAQARATATRGAARPDVAKLSLEMNALAERQLALEAELQTLSRAAADSASESAPSVRTLELEQELRHNEAMQQWLEDQLVTK